MLGVTITIMAALDSVLVAAVVAAVADVALTPVILAVASGVTTGTGADSLTYSGATAGTTAFAKYIV